MFYMSHFWYMSHCVWASQCVGGTHCNIVVCSVYFLWVPLLVSLKKNFATDSISLFPPPSDVRIGVLNRSGHKTTKSNPPPNPYQGITVFIRSPTLSYILWNENCKPIKERAPISPHLKKMTSFVEMKHNFGRVKRGGKLTGSQLDDGLNSSPMNVLKCTIPFLMRIHVVKLQNNRIN